MLVIRTLGLSGTVLAVMIAVGCGSNKASGGPGGGEGASTASGAGGGASTTTGSGAGAGPSSTTGSSSSASGGGTSGGGIFMAQEPWNTPVDQDPVDPSSSTILSWLESAGGWGNGDVLQIDTSINIQYATASTPMTPFTLTQGACTPDCDNVTTFPVPAGGAVEGEQGYACTMGGDCHLLVVDPVNHMLYEMWDAFDPPATGSFNSGGGAFLWDLTKAYPPNLRGDGCTSADAGGFPIAAMLFTADEVAAGHIDHAIRFILPNARIRDDALYVHPATHSGVNTHMPVTRPDAPPYGVRFRLKSTFDLTTLPSAGAQTVARALQKYGMLLADGGNIALTAADDRFTTAKWADADVNVDPKALSSLQVSDFEIVDMGTVVTTGDNCIRNP
jgi:hypothetical protein